MLQRGFRDSSQELYRWSRGESALAAFMTGEIAPEDLSVLVVDLTLVGMDGYELIERVRSLPQGADIPICVLSGSERVGAAVRAGRAGADRFVVKPRSSAGLRALPAYLDALARDRLARMRSISAVSLDDETPGVGGTIVPPHGRPPAAGTRWLADYEPAPSSV
jgi:CheY-like chemotaxis protein